MNYEDQMKFSLDRGNRSYRHMIELAKSADLEINRIKEVYQIANPIVADQLKKYQKLHESCIELKADLLMRGTKEKNEDGSDCTVVDVSAGRWITFNKALGLLSND